MPAGAAAGRARAARTARAAASVGWPRRLSAPVGFVIAAVLLGGCGKKGPPLPPLVRIPSAPADLVAERRGNAVDLRFVVPAANTDGTRPADVERVEIYGYTGPRAVSDADLLARGTMLASVEVKAPRDPDRTIDPDEPASDMEPLEGPGLDQGAAAHVSEDVTAEVMAAAVPPPSPPVASGPLTGPPGRLAVRHYVGVGISTGGRRSPLSPRAAVPLGSAPAPVPQPTVTYDESGVTIVWTGSTGAAVVQEPASGDVLPARVIGVTLPPAIAYNVYDVAAPLAEAASSPAPGGGVEFETRLTQAPVAGPEFVDQRIEWGATRCYTVRVVQIVDGLTLESDPAPPACETFADTFAPAPPSGLNVVASQGAIGLIWEPNGEKDLAGYVVLRGAAAAPGGAAAARKADPLTPVTPAPIQETTFTDPVAPGVQYVYAVQAVDTAGNVSAESTRVAEVAR